MRGLLFPHKTSALRGSRRWRRWRGEKGEGECAWPGSYCTIIGWKVLLIGNFCQARGTRWLRAHGSLPSGARRKWQLNLYAELQISRNYLRSVDKTVNVVAAAPFPAHSLCVERTSVVKKLHTMTDS